MTLFDFFRFITQVFLAFAGAAAFWGFFFASKKELSVSRLFAKPLFFSVAISVILLSIFKTIFPISAFAHEGIAVTPERVYLERGFSIAGALLIALFALTILFLLILQRYGSSQKSLMAGNAAAFILLVVIISMQVITRESGRQQIFFSLHSLHSIFTLGTVLCVDFLFLMSKLKGKLAFSIYPHFWAMSAAIWLGLGIDFLSAYLIFDDALLDTQKFHFSQTVISIIIINGALLAGKITKILNYSLKDGAVRPIPKKWNAIAGISGSVSIVSWFTITFVDFFPEMTLRYGTLMSFYILAILAAWTAHHTFEKRFVHDKVKADGT